jgi:predicted unusual protein kinase regulating ubiquinone biosynthesis (AarF/ABC1/UbiB family)
MPSQGDAVPRGRIRRTMPLAGFTTRAVGGRLVAGLRERAGNDGAVEQFHERTAERYAELLGHSKGALMKVGQMMSMVDARALGTGGFAPYQKAMSRLQADAPPMHPALVRELLHTELGAAVEQFAEFTDAPIAAASIGQVHRAVLRDGRGVVVKIQYPGVAQAIRDDLANTELVATFLRFMAAASGMKMDTRAVAREAAARISEEVDYRHEAATIATYSDLYRGHPFIRVPDVVPEVSGDRVLTMTYLDGMDWAAAQQADQDLKNTWAEAIVRFNQSSFRHANLMHADPHPGNYRFNTDGTVGFVDFMLQAGFLDDESDLTADELYQWQADSLYEIFVAPQPATYSPQTTRRVLDGFFVDPRDDGHPIGRMSTPDDYVFAARGTFALNAVTAGLVATLPMRAILDDLDGVAEPITELGKLHQAWVRERGLPGALDHHDQL